MEKQAAAERVAGLGARIRQETRYRLSDRLFLLKAAGNPAYGFSGTETEDGRNMDIRLCRTQGIKKAPMKSGQNMGRITGFEPATPWATTRCSAN